MILVQKIVTTEVVWNAVIPLSVTKIHASSGALAIFNPLPQSTTQVSNRWHHPHHPLTAVTEWQTEREWPSACMVMSAVFWRCWNTWIWKAHGLYFPWRAFGPVGKKCLYNIVEPKGILGNFQKTHASIWSSRCLEMTQKVHTLYKLVVLSCDKIGVILIFHCIFI